MVVIFISVIEYIPTLIVLNEQMDDKYLLAQAETMIGESTISVNKNGFYIKRYKYYIENYHYTITRYQEVCLLWID